VDAMYELHFKNRLSKSEYYALNYKACEELKKKVRSNQLVLGQNEEE
jgi:hypothetical protein